MSAGLPDAAKGWERSVSGPSATGRPWLARVAILGLLLVLFALIVDAVRGTTIINQAFDRDRTTLAGMAQAIRIYAMQQDERLPSRWPLGARLTDARSGYAASVAGLEILAASGWLDDRRHLQFSVRTLDLPRSPLAATATGTAWLEAGLPMGIAYDWSAPSSALTPARPLLAIRSASAGMVVMAFGDGSAVASAPDPQPIRPAATLDAYGRMPLLVNPGHARAVGDLIFDGVGDEGPGADPLAVGRGSATRAWLR